MSIKLSLVELGAVNYGQTRSDAIKDVVTTAQKIEEWGYNRIWLAEHHNTANMISRAPEVTIPLVASNTSHIRVGSGSVLLNHYEIATKNRDEIIQRLVNANAPLTHNQILALNRLAFDKN